MIPEPDYTIEDALAIQAVVQGKASDGQQKHAIAVIMGKLCGVYLDEFATAEADREIHHASGRRYVGIWINKLSDPSLPEKMRQAESRAAPPPKVHSRVKRPK